MRSLVRTLFGLLVGGLGARLLGLLGRFLARVLRVPARTARRLVHLTPASAVITVASISAAGALSVGATQVAVPGLRPGDVVMVKGSLGMRMGPLVEAIRTAFPPRPRNS